MAQKSQPYVIPFGAAGMVSHPNRWRAEPGELYLGENVTVENDLLQKEPAAAYYDTVGTSALTVTGTWPTAPTRWLAMGLWYAATMTPYTDWGGDPIRPNYAPGGPYPSINLTVTGGPWAVGLVHFVYLGAPGGPLATAVTDNQGNIYSLAQDFTEPTSALHGQIWVSVLTAPLTAGNLLTLTFGGSGATNIIYMSTTWSNVPLPLTRCAAVTSSGTGTAITTPAAVSATYPLFSPGLVLGTGAPGLPTMNAPWSVDQFFAAGSSASLAGLHNPFGPIASSARIVAQTTWISDDPSTPAGTVTVASGSTTVVGSGTTFTTTFRPGDTLYIGGESHIVDHVTNDTTLVTVRPWQMTQNAASYARQAGPVVITAIAQDGPYDSFVYKETPTPGALGDHGTLAGVQLASDVMKSTVGTFVRGGKEIAANPRKLFYFNGAAQVHVLSGDANTMHILAKPTADWGSADDPTKQPINAIVYDYRLIAFGNLNNPHTIYGSNPMDHEDFQNITEPNETFTLTIASSVGTRLYGAAIYQGVLFFWKYPLGIFYLDDTAGADPVQAPWGYRARSLALGCAPSPHAVLETDDDVIFCDAEGHFHLLSAVASLGGTRDSDLTRMFGLHTWTANNIDIAALTGMCSVYDDQTKIAWFGLRSLQATAPGNDLILRWDCSLLASGGAVRLTTSRLWHPTSLCTKRRDFLGRTAVMIAEASNSWFVQPGTYGTRTNYDSVAGAEVPLGVPTTVQLPELECWQQAQAYTIGSMIPQPLGRVRRKAFRALEIISNGAAAPPQTLTIAVVVDTVLRQTLKVPTGPTRRRIVKLNAGDGYACGLTLSTDGSVTGDVPLVALTLYFDLLSTDMSRAS